MRHPEQHKQQARELHAQGHSIRSIAAALGVPDNTARRWLSNEFRVKQNAKARAYKERHRGRCNSCGQPTWMGSTRCKTCAHEQLHAQRQWTKEKIIQAIQAWANQHGRPPLASDWARAQTGTHPAASTVHQGTRRGYFDKWADAIEAAGYPRPNVGHKKLDHHQQQQQAKQLIAQGHTVEQIAEIMRQPPSTIRRWLNTSREQPFVYNKPPKRTREQRINDLRAALGKQ